MSRMSAKFVGNVIGKSTSWVYSLWHEMDLITKDKYGDWILTELGRSIGGKMSNGYYKSVPTFKFDVIEQQMIDFYKKNKM